MKDTLRLRNYLKFPSVKVIVKKIAYKSLKNVRIYQSCWRIWQNLAMKTRFSWSNSVEIVSNMSQPIQNIIINDRNYILDLYKWHKGRFKKDAHSLLKTQILICETFIIRYDRTSKYQCGQQKGNKRPIFVD